MNDHFSGCPCPNCKPSRGVWWALGSVGALSALSLWGSARRGSSNLTEDEHTVLFSLVSAIVDSGDPKATRLFYPNDEEWPAVQSLIRKGLADEIRWPGGHYFVGFGLDPVNSGDRSIEVAATAAGVELHEGGRGSRAGYTLGDLAKIQKNMKRADFWLKPDGEPTRTFNKKLIGIKIRRTDLLLPEYAFYMMMHIYVMYSWPTHIVNVQDVRSLPIATK